MPTRDCSGQFRRDLGWKTTTTGGRAQQRFYLGHDPDEAAVAERRLAQFWVALERYFERERDGEVCRWEGWSLDLAKQIADGRMVVAAAVPAHVCTHGDGDGPVAAAGWYALLKTYFGTVCGVEPAEPGVATKSEAVFTRRAEFHLDLGRRMLATVGRPPTGETLHAAVDAYVAHLHAVHRTAEGAVSQTGKKQGERATRLKAHHPDFPLPDLTAKAIEGMLRYWGQRPAYGDGQKRYSRDTCKNQMILVRMFLRWLHGSDLRWELPPGFLFPRVRIEWRAAEVSARVARRTFTVAEVGLLWRHATPLERAFIALAVNCGFGIGEIGTLAEAEVQGRYVKRLRHKTKVFGAWWLFPITREAVGWARKRKAVLGLISDYLLVSEAGRPYTAVTAGNNSDQKVRNAWGRLTRRVRRDHPNFPRHSFGKLRKTAASWVRKTGGGELASIFIAHGKATGDGLLDLYADRQFKQLYRCQKRVWRRLAGVLTGPFPEPRAKNPTVRSLGDPLVRRIQRLRTQGYTLAAIADMTRTPLPTVKQAARARPPADSGPLGDVGGGGPRPAQ